MANGTCRLTGTKGKFVKSHLIPKALTRPEEPGLPLIQGGSGKRARKRWDSWYDSELVTREGEDILSALDDWAIRYLRSQTTLRDCDFGAVLRGLAAFAATRLAAAFFATFVDLMDVLLAIAFTRRCLRYATL
jgi:hypothetical protein